MKEIFSTFPLKMLNPREWFKKEKLPSLKERFQSFQALLEANNAALEVMGDLEGKCCQVDYRFDRQYIRNSYNQMRERILQMIGALNGMVPDRYLSLYDIFKSIDSGIQDAVFGVREIPLSPFTIPLEEITREMGESVGGKNANLGEMRNHIGLPVPEAFAISAYAYKKFVEGNVLGNETRKRLAALNIDDPIALHQLSQEIQEAIFCAPIPQELEEAIFRAYSRLTAGSEGDIPVSIRSSAIKEDGDVSFAGQYATLLNVRPHGLLSAYKEVLASKFTPEAIFYWKEKGFNEEDIPMAVVCQVMVHGRTSGVMFSQDPNHINRNVVIISAIWGLGELVAGQSSNVYIVSRETGEILERRIPRQETMLVSKKSGVREVSVPDGMQEQPCLSEDEVQELFRYALQLEAYYQTPRDIEWVIDGDGKIYILQTRSLSISSELTEESDESSVDPYAEPGPYQLGSRCLTRCRGWSRSPRAERSGPPSFSAGQRSGREKRSPQVCHRYGSSVGDHCRDRQRGWPYGFLSPGIPGTDDRRCERRHQVAAARPLDYGRCRSQQDLRRAGTRAGPEP